jgi:NADPH:quinone reductase-like Zn-dependent oxidoreductase
MQDLDEINVSEVATPQADEGEVIVQIAAAGVNFVDILYVRRHPTPLRLGFFSR